jgi:hypothetical protein
MKAFLHNNIEKALSHWLLCAFVVVVGSQVSVCSFRCHTAYMCSDRAVSNVLANAPSCCSSQHATSAASTCAANGLGSCDKCEITQQQHFLQSTIITNFEICHDTSERITDIYTRGPVDTKYSNYRRLTKQRPPSNTPRYLFFEILLI